LILKLTKNQLIALFNAMSEIKKQLALKKVTSTKVYYPTGRNLRIIKNEIDALIEVSPQTIQEAYNTEINPILVEKCNKDEEGNPILERGNYSISDEVGEELKIIWETKYLEDYNKKQLEFQELLKVEIDIDLLSINSKDLIAELPELSVEIIDSLMLILED